MAKKKFKKPLMDAPVKPLVYPGNDMHPDSYYNTVGIPIPKVNKKS